MLLKMNTRKRTTKTLQLEGICFYHIGIKSFHFYFFFLISMVQISVLFFNYTNLFLIYFIDIQLVKLILRHQNSCSLVSKFCSFPQLTVSQLLHVLASLFYVFVFILSFSKNKSKKKRPTGGRSFNYLRFKLYLGIFKLKKYSLRPDFRPPKGKQLLENWSSSRICFSIIRFIFYDLQFLNVI